MYLLLLCENCLIQIFWCCTIQSTHHKKDVEFPENVPVLGTCTSNKKPLKHTGVKRLPEMLVLSYGRITQGR